MFKVLYQNGQGEWIEVEGTFSDEMGANAYIRLLNVGGVKNTIKKKIQGEACASDFGERRSGID